MKKSLILTSILSLVLLGCNSELDYTIRGYTQKIIVEGSIGENEFARVYVSLNIPLSKNIDSTTILNHVIRVAKVTISDGTNTEVLTGSWDKTHYPPYVYQSTQMKGIAGRDYSMRVDYSGYTVTSSTSIPLSTKIDSITFNNSPISDTLRILTMHVNIDPSKKSSFRVFTKKKKDGFYTETPIVYNAEFSLSGKQGLLISPQPNSNDPSYHEGSYFAVGEMVDIKLLAIDSTSTDFYKDLSIFSSTTGVGINYFNGEKKPLPSNISEPGFGIWWGYGASKYTIQVK